MKFHLIPSIPETKNLSAEGLITIELIPIVLIETFGKPGDCDGYKVSGIYRFANAQGDIFTIYDWKTTTLYHGEDSSCLPPEEFWREEELHDFNIGGNNEKLISAFVDWLFDEFNKPYLPVIK